MHAAVVCSNGWWRVPVWCRRWTRYHEADRWVAAVAVAGGYPLATEDAIFDDVVTLHRKFPDA